MKKIFKIIYCASVLSVVFCKSAFAATNGYTTGDINYNAENGIYTAICNTDITDGNQYVLLVIKGTENNYVIDEDTIMYIDQQEAIEGSVSFNFIPQNTPECIVLLGGEFIDGTSPKIIGTLLKQGSTIDGDINEDNSVNSVDLGILISDFGSSQSNPPKNSNSDIDKDGSVNVVDLSILISNFGKSI